MFTSSSTYRFFFVILLTWASCLLAQDTAEAPASDLDTRLFQADIAVQDLRSLVRPLTRDELDAVVEKRMAHMRILLGEIAQSEVAYTAAGEDTQADHLAFLNELFAKRSAAAERLNVVFDSLEAKGGDPAELRQYIKATSGLSVSVNDPHAVTSALRGWLQSKEGGHRWGFNLLKCFGVLLLSVLVARITVRITSKAFALEQRMSQLLEQFILRIVRWVVLFGGLLIALTMLEIDVGPILAFIGAGGFIIGFALKDALGNFASGILILFYKPFDVGHSIEVAGITGKVSDMNLVSTIVHTFDNKEVIIPNNTVWRDVITNSNATAQRRVDLVFSIRPEDDIDEAQAILERLCAEHPKVLEDPGTTIKVNALSPGSVDFVCRPWAATSDFGDVKWDLTRSVKSAFDAAGIRTSIPQQTIMLESGKE